MPSIKFRLSFSVRILMLSSKAQSICSWDQSSDFFYVFIGLSNSVAIFFPLSCGGSFRSEISCWTDSVLMSSGRGWTRRSLRRSSGFKVGEPSSIWTILRVGIGGSIDYVSRNASMVSFVLILAISQLLLNVFANDDGYVTEDHLIFSASERTFTGFSVITWSPKTPFSIRSSDSSSIDSGGSRDSASSISSLDDSSGSVNSETNFHWILLSL